MWSLYHVTLHGRAVKSDIQIRGRKMKAINYWDKFMITGKIDDFLAYRNAAATEHTEKDETEERSGEHSHAGEYTGYGNGFKG